jgi:hypothetical protein
MPNIVLLFLYVIRFSAKEENMKRLFVVLVVVAASLLIAGTAFAAGQAQNNTGCGLGTMIFRNNAQDTTLLQVIQLSLNDFGLLILVPTFGITFGTAECRQPKYFAGSERANEFMTANMDNLARDIAQGRGESLDAFAELMRVPTEERPDFYLKLQSNFARIYTSNDVQMANVMDNIATVSK